MERRTLAMLEQALAALRLRAARRPISYPCGEP